MANSRMRDFFDIYELARKREFDGALLALAIEKTFARRRTPLGPDLPVALTPVFAVDRDKQTQWRAFLRKSRQGGASPDLAVTVSAIAAFLGPIVVAAESGRRFAGRWPPGGGWGT
jgi:hypothetical protein